MADHTRIEHESLAIIVTKQMTTKIEIQGPSLTSSILSDSSDQTIPGSLSLSLGAPGDGKKRDPGYDVVKIRVRYAYLVMKS